MSFGHRVGSLRFSILTAAISRPVAFFLKAAMFLVCLFFFLFSVFWFYGRPRPISYSSVHRIYMTGKTIKRKKNRIQLVALSFPLSFRI